MSNSELVYWYQPNDLYCLSLERHSEYSETPFQASLPPANQQNEATFPS
jgi:hypothetical protein